MARPPRGRGSSRPGRAGAAGCRCESSGCGRYCVALAPSLAAAPELPAGVEPVLLGGDVPRGMVGGLDVARGRLAPLGRAKRRVLAVVVGQPGVVDLEDEAGLDDRLVLRPHGLGHGEAVLLVGAVVLVT